MSKPIIEFKCPKCNASMRQQRVIWAKDGLRDTFNISMVCGSIICAKEVTVIGIIHDISTGN